MSQEDKNNGLEDQNWADLVSPERRNLIVGTGIAAVTALGATVANAQNAPVGSLGQGAAYVPPKAEKGKSPWGYETYKEPAKQPVSVRPNEQTLPTNPQPYTRIQSYHAHVYFDEDTYQKAGLLRQWVIERFPVELGNWNLQPRGPHVTPSFYFGFTNEQFPVIVPWLQLNSLGLTILLHPNSDDPRADHLYYALWINRTQPVNAYTLKSNVSADEVEKIYPNIKPTKKVEI